MFKVSPTFGMYDVGGSVEVDIKHAAAGAAEEGDDEAAQPGQGHVRRRQARQQKRAPRRAHLVPQLILKLYVRLYFGPNHCKNS